MTVPMSFATSRWLRLSLLLLPLCMGIALVTSSISDRQRAYAASDLLIRGQVDWLLRSLGQALRNAEGPADRELLEEVLEDFEPEGLRYLALLDRGGNVRVDAGAGSPAGAGRQVSPKQGSLLEIERVGARVRVTANPPKRRLRLVPGRRQRASYETRQARSVLVVEFEPSLADTLRRDADRAFALSAVAALVLMLVAGALWWQLRRQELAASTLERERRLAQLGEMSAVLAHEMRNPLASLKGHAQLLVEQLPHGTREANKAERIVNEATRLETLSTTLLDFVRSGAIEKESVEVMALIRQAAEEVGAERIVIEGPPGDLEASLDPMRMRQVLVNLLQNALQASSEDQPVTVAVSQTGKRLHIEVRDRGPGLTPGDEQHVFEAFQTKKTHGTGLGLAIARRIVELHDGRISASNHPEGGAVFMVELPL